jgi:hypothetical protein
VSLSGLHRLDLLLQEELLATVPRPLTGHALGLDSCGTPRDRP